MLLLWFWSWRRPLTLSARLGFVKRDLKERPMDE
jgi:hypothetical protein